MDKISDLVALNLDPALMIQHDVMSRVKNVINLRSLNGLRMMSDTTHMARVSSCLSFTNSSAALIGSGDFHHLSLAILANIKIPFTLVVFDNHTDLMNMNKGYISCGSWIRESFRLKWLKSVIIIGVNPDDEALKFIHPFSKPIHIILSRTQTSSKKMYEIIKEIKTKSLYVSIDKDVLNSACASTNWNQGSMDINELIDYLNILIAAKKLIGMDICGEWKIYDKMFMSDYDIEAVRRNEAANIKILETVS
jgi:arginase family enzyme